MIPRRAIHIINGEFQALIQAKKKSASASLELVHNWETVFADYIETKYAIAVGSGRMGLRLILDSLGLKEKDEVIIPAYTLGDLIGTINSLGLVAVPADIDPDTFNISLESILKRITRRSKVILATHIFGMPCAIDGILKIAKENGIAVIEDCAHAAGSEFKGRKVGSFGEAALFSFETIKPINTYGGGMVVTHNENLAIKIRRKIEIENYDRRLPIKKIFASRFERRLLSGALAFIPLYFLASKHWHDKIYRFYRSSQKSLGLNKTISGFQAQLGIEKIGTLEARISSRRKQAELFKRLLNNKIILQYNPASAASNYYFFVVLLPVDIWKARKFLLRQGIDAGIGAEIADDCSGILGYKDCPQAANIFSHAIQLPLHEGVSQAQIRDIADKLNKFIDKT